MATTSTQNSLSDTAAPKSTELSTVSRKDLESLRTFLDRDFQSFWEVRRFGSHIGLRIKCPVCAAEAPQRTHGEDLIWYGYRKWRWLANHMASEHCRAQALTFQHRQAIKRGNAKLSETKFAGKKTSAA